MEPLPLRRAQHNLTTMRNTRSYDDERLPNFVRALPASLPDDCRARCERCRGRGSYSDIETLIACQDCHSNGMACKLHVCRMCGGSGLVCPACRGVRLVRSREWDTNTPRGEVEIERCPRCWDATNNRVDPMREKRVIDRYLVRYRYEQGVPAAEIPAGAPDALEVALAASRARTYAREGDTPTRE